MDNVYAPLDPVGTRHNQVEELVTNWTNSAVMPVRNVSSSTITATMQRTNDVLNINGNQSRQIMLGNHMQTPLTIRNAFDSVEFFPNHYECQDVNIRDRGVSLHDLNSSVNIQNNGEITVTNMPAKRKRKNKRMSQNSVISTVEIDNSRDKGTTGARKMHSQRIRVLRNIKTVEKEPACNRTISPPDQVCPNCSAIVWKEEKRQINRGMTSPYAICCSHGKILLPILRKTPPLLDLLLDPLSSTFEAKRFQNKIRKFNSMFSFTSFGANIDFKVLRGRGPYTFRIYGQCYHLIGSLVPTGSEKPRYAQLYIYDTEKEVANRYASGQIKNFSVKDSTEVDRRIISNIQQVLDATNKYDKDLRRVRDWYEVNSTPKLSLRLVERSENLKRPYSNPSAVEIAGLIVGDVFQVQAEREIVVSTKKSEFKKVSETNRANMALQYPILFPYGEDGWHPELRSLAQKFLNSKRGKITMMEYYAYRLQHRIEEGTTFLRGGKLLHQALVDAYCAVERYRLDWIANHQRNIRAEVYSGVQDAVDKDDHDASKIGKKLVLPASFTGGPRYMTQNYQDAMCICAWAGMPDLFITITSNPNWREIRDFLAFIPGQKPSERPDVVSRVFKIKLRQVCDDIIKGQSFGQVIADLSVIEFQKRGLPHCHLLLTLEKSSKLRDTKHIDDIICAELPNPITDPQLHALVCNHMIHGPCGPEFPTTPCMRKNKCTRGYPKPFVNETHISIEGFTIYRRRNNGVCASVRNTTINNRWVVPYNKELLLKFQCHINIEKCNQNSMIKYLFKYVHKGSDSARIVITDPAKKYDEIQKYIDSRYISACEATWRLFNFHIHARHPPVQRLTYHLPDEQLLYFQDAADLEQVLNNIRSRTTMLTEWFENNKIDIESQKLLYIEYPQHYVWSSRELRWTKRKQGFSIGRLSFAHPASGERYYLRLLLTVVRGAQSFQHLRTVNGLPYTTFKEACIAYGLLEDDSEWTLALQEATNWAMPRQLRRLFATMLLYCELSNPLELWIKFADIMYDDYQRDLQNDHAPNIGIDAKEYLRNKALIDIDEILQHNGKSLSEIPQMKVPNYDMNLNFENSLIFDELNYNRTKLGEEAITLATNLNSEQRNIYDNVLSSCNNNCGKLFFVYGGGGTGKTYIWRCLATKLRSEGKIVLTVASSGIAALLLPGGRTAHSKFKIPLNIDEYSTCAIGKQTKLAKLIQKTDLVIWDEAPMITKYAFDALNKSFRDIMSSITNDAHLKLFGGKTVVLGGDFRQTLPIVEKATKQEIIDRSLHRSTLWPSCNLFQLHINMRLRKTNNVEDISESEVSYAEWILKMGNGDLDGIKNADNPDVTWIKVPDHMLLSSDATIKDLVNAIYPNPQLLSTNPQLLESTAILACRNDEVDEINDDILNLLPGECKEYLSADSKITTTKSSQHDDIIHTEQFLNEMKCSGLPNHRLKVKIGCPIMLLRNLNQSVGLCNGTRLVVKRMANRVIEARMLTKGDVVEDILIPRIVMSSERKDFPFTLRRRQFPFKVAYAMTINKSQGQSLQNIGLYLKTPVFSHGQLYVAFSRAKSRSSLTVLLGEQTDIPFSYTANIVYKDVLEEILNQAVFMENPNMSNKTSTISATDQPEQILAREHPLEASTSIGKAQTEPPTPAKKGDTKRSANVSESEVEESSKKKKPKPIKLDVPTVTFDAINTVFTLYNIKVYVLTVHTGKLYGPRTENTITFIAVDTKGRSFEVIIHDPLFETWKKRIKEGHVYLLKKAKCIEAKRYPKVVNEKFQLFLDDQSHAAELRLDQFENPTTLQTTKLSEIPRGPEEPNYLFNVTGYLIDVRAPCVRTGRNRSLLQCVESYIIDDSNPKLAFVLTVWLDLYEQNIDLFYEALRKPIIITATGLKLRKFTYGKILRTTLQTTTFTKFTQDPTASSQAKQLDQWIQKNLQLKIRTPDDFVQSKRLILIAEPKEFKTITQAIEATPTHLEQSQEPIVFCINATVIGIDLDQDIAYECCAKCGSATHTKGTSVQGCNRCNKYPPEPVTKYRIVITVADNTRSIRMTLFDREAQELLHYPVEQMLELRRQVGGEEGYRAKFTAALNSAYTFTVKVTNSNIPYIQRTGYTVQTIEWLPRRCISANKTNNNISLNLLTTPSVASTTKLAEPPVNETVEESSEESFAALSSDDNEANEKSPPPL